jgi:hypothetical protein
MNTERFKIWAKDWKAYVGLVFAVGMAMGAALTMAVGC